MTYLPLSYALIYFALANVAGLGLMLLDRHRGKTRGKRISELWLFLLGLAGGATAMFMTMLATKHKIRYVHFRFGLPIMMVLHGVVLALMVQYGPTYHVQINIMIEYIIVALVLVNFFAAAVTNWDKKNAQKGMWRVPEAWLMFLGAIGGAFAMLLTMCVIHHKTRYPKFMVGLPLMILAQVLALIWVFSEYCTFIVVITF